jgi:hypothetical protein
MTGLLRDTMNERADAAGYPQLDLDAIIEAGDRRVRRRRVAISGGAAMIAAAVVAAVALGPSTLDFDTDGGHAVGQPPGVFAQDRPTYAVGSTIHYGADAYKLDYQVRSFAQTDDGFVYTAPEGQVMFTDGDTEQQIGVTESQGSQLASDDSGPYVGWTDSSGLGAPEFVVYDTAKGEEVVRTAEGSLPGAAQNDIDTMSAMIAIDDGVAYWHDGTGVKAYDIASGTLTTIKDGADASWLDDVENGVLSHSSDLHYRGDAGAQRIIVSADPEATDPSVARWSYGYLSPDAQHVALAGGDQTEIVDVATGADATPPHPGYGVFYLGQWIDDDRLTFVAFPGSAPTGDTVDVLECSIAQQTCEVAFSDVTGTGHDPVLFPGMPAG